MRLLRAGPFRWRCVMIAREAGPPGSWVAAGLVRDAVWDHGHGRDPVRPGGDVDVVWHDPDRADPAVDRNYEARLARAAPCSRWSVKNQARMHGRNDDRPYRTVADAMRFWPDTATAVAVCRIGPDGLAVRAPFGLEDLFGSVLRPGPAFRGERRALFETRIAEKRWKMLWPMLRRADD